MFGKNDLHEELYRAIIPPHFHDKRNFATKSFGDTIVTISA